MSQAKIPAPQSNKSSTQQPSRESKQTPSSAEVRNLASLGTQGSGDPLPFLNRIQSAFGHHDLRGVRSFVGAAARETNQALGARGFTFGNRIAFDTPNPSLHIVAHEAAHVIQQQAGVQLSRGIGEVGDRYEQQAEKIAHAVVHGDNVESMLDQIAPSSSLSQCSPSSSCVQLYTEEKELDDQKSITYNVTRFVSENSELMCYGHGKDVFYATKAKINESNQALQAAGSFVRLIEPDQDNSASIATKTVKRANENGQLVDKLYYRCIPKWNTKDPKLLGMHGVNHSDLNDANEQINTSNAKLKTAKNWRYMKLWHDCGRSSSAVMGSASGMREALYQKVRKQNDEWSLTGANAHPLSFRNEIHSLQFPEFLKKNVQFIVEDVHKPVYSNQNKNKVKYFKGLNSADDCVIGYYAMNKQGQDAYDEAVKVNRAVFPEIAEGYAMITEKPSKDWKSKKEQFQFHWAGVIAKDGKDRVALEAEASSINPWIFDDLRWNFEMYGPHEGQTFHDKHLATGSHGDRATSVRVRVPPKMVNSQFDFYLDEGLFDEKTFHKMMNNNDEKQPQIQSNQPNRSVPAPIPHSISMLNLHPMNSSQSNGFTPAPIPRVSSASDLNPLNSSSAPKPPMLSLLRNARIRQSNLSVMSLNLSSNQDQLNGSSQHNLFGNQQDDDDIFQEADGLWYRYYDDVNRNRQKQRVNPPRHLNQANVNNQQNNQMLPPVVINNNQNQPNAPLIVSQLKEQSNQSNSSNQLMSEVKQNSSILSSTIDEKKELPIISSTLDDKKSDLNISSIFDDKKDSSILSSTLDDKENKPIISSTLDDTIQDNKQIKQQSPSPKKKFTAPSLGHFRRQQTQYELRNDYDAIIIRNAANLVGLNYYRFIRHSIRYLMRKYETGRLVHEFSLTQQQADQFYRELRRLSLEQ